MFLFQVDCNHAAVGEDAEAGLAAEFSCTPVSALGSALAILVSTTDFHPNSFSLLGSHFPLLVSSLTYRPLGFTWLISTGEWSH